MFCWTQELTEILNKQLSVDFDKRSCHSLNAIALHWWRILNTFVGLLVDVHWSGNTMPPSDQLF